MTPSPRMLLRRRLEETLSPPRRVYPFIENAVTTRRLLTMSKVEKVQDFNFFRNNKRQRRRMEKVRLCYNTTQGMMESTTGLKHVWWVAERVLARRFEGSAYLEKIAGPLERSCESGGWPGQLSLTSSGISSLLKADSPVPPFYKHKLSRPSPGGTVPHKKRGN